jgi:hypothetical protein
MLHMAQLRDAIAMYSDDYDGRLPLAGDWCDALLPYGEDESVYVCPAAYNRSSSFALNAAVGGLRRAEIENASELVLLFESDVGWNAAGGPMLLPGQPRHRGGENLVFVDGSGGWQPRAYRGADDAHVLKRTHHDVEAGEWLKRYYGYTRPIEWDPRIGKQPMGMGTVHDG